MRYAFPPYDAANRYGDYVPEFDTAAGNHLRPVLQAGIQQLAELVCRVLHRPDRHSRLHTLVIRQVRRPAQRKPRHPPPLIVSNVPDV